MPSLRIFAIEEEPIHAEALRLAVEELGYPPNHHENPTHTQNLRLTDL